jgi:hypothetical protein
VEQTSDLIFVPRGYQKDVDRSLAVQENAESPWFIQRNRQLVIVLYHTLIIKASIVKIVLIAGQASSPHEMNTALAIDNKRSTTVPTVEAAADMQCSAPVRRRLHAKIAPHAYGPHHGAREPGTQSQEGDQDPGQPSPDPRSQVSMHVA